MYSGWCRFDSYHPRKYQTIFATTRNVIEQDAIMNKHELDTAYERLQHKLEEYHRLHSFVFQNEIEKIPPSAIDDLTGKLRECELAWSDVRNILMSDDLKRLIDSNIQLPPTMIIPKDRFKPLNLKDFE